LYFRGECEAEDLPLVEISKDLGTLGIRALGQHGALLPAVRSKYYARSGRNEVMADTKSGDLHHPLGTSKPPSRFRRPLVYNRSQMTMKPTVLPRLATTWLMAPPETIDLNKIVFNTEAHHPICGTW
jgi:hypothetical protein